MEAARLERSPLVAGLLVLIFVGVAARDLSRPYHGLHDWDRAYASWSARAHVHYGLGYTRGLGTFAVGDPPTAQPTRFLDHPQLPMLLNACAMLVFGVHEWSLRLTALLVTAACIPFLLRLLGRLYGGGAAVLATLTYVLVPVTGYFYDAWAFWMLPPTIAAWGSYLAATGQLSDVAPLRRHVIVLALSLFLALQVDWPGAFLAAALVLDHAWRRLRARSVGDRGLLAALVLAPAASLALNFLVLAGAGGWDFERLWGLYRVRSTITGDEERTIGGWLAQQLDFARSNFTLPVLLAAVAFLLLLAWRRLRRGEQASDRRFHHAWIFVGPALLNLVVFRETFWVHDFNQAVFTVPLAIMAALAVLAACDALSARASMGGAVVVAAWVGWLAFASVRQLESLRGIEIRSPAELAVMSDLQSRMQPDEALLSYVDYTVRPTLFHPAFLRPEIAWHLDREVVVVQTARDVEAMAAVGRFSFYLAESPPAPSEVVETLKARYPWERFPGRPAMWTQAGSGDFYVFDLRSQPVR